jgi:hypothetical protein
MSREYFGIEKGLHITGENTDVGVKVLFGSGAPSLEAEVASLYLRTDDGTQWRKIAAGTGTDKWEKVPVLADITQIKFRKETVVALTSDAAPISGAVIDLAADPFTDDDGATLDGASFTPGVSHVLFGHGGTEKLMMASVVAGDSVTFVDAAVPLASGDCFVVNHYLPDSELQENMALVCFNGSEYVKLGDVDWSAASGISLDASYTAASGNITSADSVNSAIEKLDGNNDAQDSVLGTSQGATDLGSFTGNIIPDGSSVKGALQAVETAVEAIDSLTKVKVSGITTVQTVDSINTKAFAAAKWHVVASLDSNPARKKVVEIYAVHDGTAVVDATTSKENEYSKMNLGASFNVNINTDLTGVGAAQVMRLRVDAAASVTVSVTRLEVDL